MPERIQRQRTAGWRMPAHAIYVGRPSRWGNWYVVRRNRVAGRDGLIRHTGPQWIVVETNRRGHPTGAQWGTWDLKVDAATFAVDLFARALDASHVDLDGPQRRARYLDGLQGHDLVCWCPLTDTDGNPMPCHADVLLELANPELTHA